MRVCIFTTSFPRNSNDDAGIFIKYLLEGFIENKIGGQILLPLDQEEPREEILGSFKIKRFSYALFAKRALAFGSGILPNIRRNPLVILQAPGMLFGFFYFAVKERNNFDLIHANWSVTGLPGLLVKILFGKPYVLTLWGEDLRLVETWIFRQILRPVFHSAASIICVSNSALEASLRYFPETRDKSRVVLSGVFVPEPSQEEVVEFKARFPEKFARKTALFIGTVIPRKKVDILVRAVAETDWNLIVCGRIENENYLQQIKILIDKFNCAERVFFEGSVEPQVIPLYLYACDAYLSASEHEGRPNAVLEAMAAGMPLVLSDIEPHRELVEPGVSGLLFNLDSHEELIKEMELLENNQKLAEQLGKSALDKIQEFSWKKCAQGYIDVFTQALKNQN